MVLGDWRVVRESKMERGVQGKMVEEEVGKDVAYSAHGEEFRVGL